MSWYLRHHLDDLQNNTNPIVRFSKKNNGSVNLSDFCKVIDTTEDLMMRVVNENDKKRFFIDVVDDHKYIGATQGHSKKFSELINDDEMMIQINEPLKSCFHGTIYKFVNSIKTTGLNRMERKHIHLIDKYNALSGTKKESTVFIFIDMKKCMDDGMVFYRSKNDVILTEGFNGIIPPEYICNVVNKKAYIKNNTFTI